MRYPAGGCVAEPRTRCSALRARDMASTVPVQCDVMRGLVKRYVRTIPFVGCLLFAGCATINPNERIQESLDLVEQRTGERPDWTGPWDELPPPWDGQSELGIDEAVELALRNNRELRADFEMIGQTHADLVQAGLLQNPRFNFMVMFPSGGGRSMLRSAGFPMQALHDLWLIPVRKEFATAKLQEAVLRVADRAVAVTGEVKGLYARLQYTQRALELIRENMDLVEQVRRLIQVQQIAGKATSVEVNVAHIRYLRLRSELLAMEAEYRSLKRQLLMQMGFAAATDAWTVAPLHEIDHPVEMPPSEQALLAQAEQERLDLQAAQWTLAAAGQRVELMRREGWPEVAAGLTFERAPAPRSRSTSLAGRAGNEVARSLQGGSPPPVLPFERSPQEMKWMVGPMFDVELPIFDRNQAQVARALHEFRQQWAEYQARHQAVALEVREAWVMYAQAVEQVRFFRESIIPEVARNLEIMRESYRAGREDVTVILQVQEDWIMTRLSALAFVRDVLVNRAELERHVGGQLRPEGREAADSDATQQQRSAAEADSALEE
jgi:outer membrane protein, heavy metal efflux system